MMNLVERAVRLYLNMHPYKSIFNVYKHNKKFFEHLTVNFRQEDINNMLDILKAQSENFPIKVGHLYLTENQRMVVITGRKQGALSDKVFYLGCCPDTTDSRHTTILLMFDDSGNCVKRIGNFVDKVYTHGFNLAEKLPMINYSHLRLTNIEE